MFPPCSAWHLSLQTAWTSRRFRVRFVAKGATRDHGAKQRLRLHSASGALAVLRALARQDPVIKAYTHLLQSFLDNFLP